MRRSIGILSIFLAAPLAAQDTTAVDPRTVQPERPTVATHAHTVAPGYFELETGIEGDRASGGARTYFAPSVLKIGLASHVQLNVIAPFVFAGQGQSSGIGDTGLGLKWRLLDDSPILGDFALLPAIKFPTGSLQNGTGTGTTDWSLTAISSYDIHGVSLDLNVGYTRIGAQGGHASSAALWTTSFGIPLVGDLGWQLELFGYPTIDGSGNPSTVAVLMGPSYRVTRIFNLDAGFISPIRGRQPNAIFAGLVWNLGSLTSHPTSGNR
jgi:outer membrane putative beta-barrel porin/alpha-amylase